VLLPASLQALGTDAFESCPLLLGVDVSHTKLQTGVGNGVTVSEVRAAPTVVAEKGAKQGAKKSAKKVKP
jgi:hypothetical protein